ncbi:hypothetical protein [Nostoc sp. 'Peltigera membranacea cyanobiont' 210A]|uniref:hypothetical protein n=1 Tax=Nostoc sp. 'Peltigera membranacea cyanobiont' 210A TaxID=2014529 RepID=UPI00167CC964|nr:hypothetical protein [Nostoc sp. 'Peltigera membranacea cyanobiont' 210A]
MEVRLSGSVFLRSQLSLLKYARIKSAIFNSRNRAMPTAGYANALSTESGKIA